MSIQSEVNTRSGTTADWAAATAPVLGVGEIGVDITKGIVKIGDGATAFASLPNSGRGKVVNKVTLVAGTKVVNEASVTAASIILLTVQSLGTVTAPKAIAVSARTPGTSFTILSADNTDTSVVGYEIIEP